MKIYMMGDSTMKFNNITSYPQVGWGQFLHVFTKNEYLIEDHAENGKSTKSFKAEGRFDVILSRLRPNDYVICQFGHNDGKKEDPTRFTEPQGDYIQNLKYYADEVTKKGAKIIFATPIARHKFIDGVLENTHTPYQNAMLQFCQENGYTCIDMSTLTMDLYKQLGEEESKKFHMIFPAGTYVNYPNGMDDHTHLRYVGALTIAEIFVRAVLASDHPIKECFLDLGDKPAILLP